MKMFLTRIGEGSKAVVTGDVTQIDLDRKRISGLVAIQRILKDIPEIKFIYLSDKDVVRHRLVKQIIRAFDRYENRQR
jgi:phosphate starvation-inducible PhoH-like protein